MPRMYPEQWEALQRLHKMGREINPGDAPFSSVAAAVRWIAASQSSELAMQANGPLTGSAYGFVFSFHSQVSTLNWHGLDIGLQPGNWAPTRGQSDPRKTVILHHVVLSEDDPGFEDVGTAGCEPYPLVLPSPNQIAKMCKNEARPCRRCAILFNNNAWKFRDQTQEVSEMTEYNIHVNVPRDAAVARAAAREADRLAGLMAQRARLDEQIARMAARPVEPEFAEDGTAPIVVFDKNFGDPDRGTWTYVAMKIAGLDCWVVSGSKQTGKNYTWQGLLDFAESGEPDLPTIYLVTSMEAI